MPYDKEEEILRKAKSVLPEHAQEVFKAAFINAWKKHSTPEKRRGHGTQEETATKVA